MQNPQPPAPNADELEHSERLQQAIRAQLDDNLDDGGVISFERFMQLALYAPGLGYYSAGSQKFGSAGDFVTAPEISSLFSRCLANQCSQVLEQTGGDVLEFGAGSGIMAAHLLLQLEHNNTLPARYLIIDLSPDLRERQRQTIEKFAPHLLSRVHWLDALPEKFRGVMLANEVLDAMPVTVFKHDQGRDYEQVVRWDKDGFVPDWRAAGLPLQLALAELRGRGISFSDGYVSEVNLQLAGWFRALSDCLQQGAVILIDYGYTAEAYYHPERHMGTLICHYRHQAHDDPFKLVGLQDITANVDFSAVSRAAQQAGLALAGYTTQANFLLATGLETLMQEYSPDDVEVFANVAQGVKALMLPSQMGERFQVIAFSQDLASPLQGFALRDLRDRL